MAQYRKYFLWQQPYLLISALPQPTLLPILCAQHLIQPTVKSPNSCGSTAHMAMTIRRAVGEGCLSSRRCQKKSMASIDISLPNPSS